MSEFRRFCIGAFVLAGVFAVAANNGLIPMPDDPITPLAATALLGGIMAVSLSGGRAR